MLHVRLIFAIISACGLHFRPFVPLLGLQPQFLVLASARFRFLASIMGASVSSRCLIHRLIASMHINIHDVHVKALIFVTSRCIDAVSLWIKQHEVCYYTVVTGYQPTARLLVVARIHSALPRCFLDTQTDRQKQSHLLTRVYYLNITWWTFST